MFKGSFDMSRRWCKWCRWTFGSPETLGRRARIIGAPQGRSGLPFNTGEASIGAFALHFALQRHVRDADAGASGLLNIMRTESV